RFQHSSKSSRYFASFTSFSGRISEQFGLRIFPPPCRSFTVSPSLPQIQKKSHPLFAHGLDLRPRFLHLNEAATNDLNSPSQLFCSRRHFVKASSFSLGSLALAWLLREEGLLAAPLKPPMGPQSFDLTPKTPPSVPRAR